jgi:hypothetical protein
VPFLLDLPCPGPSEAQCRAHRSPSTAAATSWALKFSQHTFRTKTVPLLLPGLSLMKTLCVVSALRCLPLDLVDGGIHQVEGYLFYFALLIAFHSWNFHKDCSLSSARLASPKRLRFRPSVCPAKGAVQTFLPFGMAGRAVLQNRAIRAVPNNLPHLKEN